MRVRERGTVPGDGRGDALAITNAQSYELGACCVLRSPAIDIRQ
jgi:hypothetical protein